MRAFGIASHFLFRMAQSLFILYKRNYILYLPLSYNGISGMIIPTIPPCPMSFQAFERQFVDIQRGTLSFSPQKESLQAN